MTAAWLDSLTGNHLRRPNARSIYRQMQISTRIWRHLPPYRSFRHRAGNAEAQRTALRSRGHAPRPRIFPDASASVARIAPVFFAATPTPTTSLRRGLHAGDLVDAPAPLSARRVRSGRSRLTGSRRRGRRLGPGRPRIAGALVLHASRHSRTLSSTGRILPCSLADSIPKTSRKAASPPN